MSEAMKFTAEERMKAGKGTARAIRREKKIPAVIYGDNKEPVMISLPLKEVTLEVFKGHFFTNICEITIGGKVHKVIARDVQFHPVADNVLHIDFLRITAKTKIAVNVPVHFINEDTCPGLKSGGVLGIIRHDVELLCSAVAIPESIEIDLSNFEVGDSIKISDTKLPKGVEPVITDRDFTIANIAMPRVVSEETEDDEGESEETEGNETASTESSE